MVREAPLEVTGTVCDALEKDQSKLLHEYVLSKEWDEPAGEWSHRGPRSLAPFVPCTASRIPHIFAAARLTPQDVIYDLGCGDGRVLHEAATRYGCRCVGVEVDEDCLVSCREGARALGPELEALFRWELADFQELSTDFFTTGQLPREGSEPLPPPTVVLIFITGHGLVAMSSWLHQCWEAAAQGVRLLTCVDSLDTALDYTDPDPLFQEPNRDEWEVYRDPVHARYGVFVVPPCGCSLQEWGASAPVPAPMTKAMADEADVVVVRGLLSATDLDAIARFAESIAPKDDDSDGDGIGIAGMLWDTEEDCFEDAYHGLRQHRVVHLHREGLDASPLVGVRAKLLRAIYKADDECWGWLRGRVVNVRSFEHHSYEPGGSVSDPEHRDAGSILTISVLLGRSDGCEGGHFRASVNDEWCPFEVSPGDAVVFPSEKRHNVTPITAGTRESMVMELWEGGVTRHNRHK